MTRDLTNSNIDRQNILNNNFALMEIERVADIKGVLFEGKYRLTKEMIANFFSVDTRTIERYTSDFSDELKSNGYELLKGRRLKEFFEQVKLQNVPDINVGNKTPQLAIFDFRTFLNISMLLIESENARVLRQTILVHVNSIALWMATNGWRFHCLRCF